MRNTFKLGDFLSEYDELREPTKRDRIIRDEDYKKAWLGVLDTKTIEALETLKRRKIIGELGWIISTGKEADVFYARAPDGDELAVKIYRIHTSGFRNIDIYVMGDRRFSRARSPLKAKWSWARREFKNLKRAKRVGVNVPTPISVYRNIVVMEFIGENGIPARLLKDIDDLINPQKTFEILMNDIKKLYRNAKIVHADLSPFNILYHKGIPYIIDMAQGVDISHVYALKFLYRDIRNLRAFFLAYIDDIPNEEQLFYEITGLEPNDLIKNI